MLIEEQVPETTIKDEVLTQSETERTVVVHCSFSALISTGIRIWSSTYLVDRLSGSKSKLLHALNISFQPEFTIVKHGTTARFTLIFAALPKTCEVFNLIEEAPEPYVFEVFNIKRNLSDVYEVAIINPFINSNNINN